MLNSTKDFTKFHSIMDLRDSSDLFAKIPTGGGVYLVVYENNKNLKFNNPGVAIKIWHNRIVNAGIEVLEEKWGNVKGKSNILYIGKAGANNGLRNRINQYIKFGQGRNCAHYGGRFIWQIDEDIYFKDLFIYFKECDDPENKEACLLDEFIKKYNYLPFANLRREKCNNKKNEKR